MMECCKRNATSDDTIVEDITDCEDAGVAIGVVAVVVVRVRQSALYISLTSHLHVPHVSFVYSKVASQNFVGN
jgi:hypothetical protein